MRKGISLALLLSNVQSQPGQFFACRCFCGVRDYSVSNSLVPAGDRTYKTIDSSLSFAFDPQPIYSNSADALPAVVLDDKNVIKWVAMPDGTLREYMSIVAATRGPAMNAIEGTLFESLKKTNSELAQSVQDVVKRLVMLVFTGLGVALENQEPFATGKKDSIRFVPSQILPNTPFADRAICMSMCRNEVIEYPHPLRRLFEHPDYAILKHPSLHPRGNQLSPERPEWGLVYVELPEVQNLPRNQTWEKVMQTRWGQLYELPARFDPKTGQVKQDGSGGSAPKLCSALRDQLKFGNELSSEQLKSVTIQPSDYMDPVALRPKEYINPIATKAYVIRRHDKRESYPYQLSSDHSGSGAGAL